MRKWVKYCFIVSFHRLFFQSGGEKYDELCVGNIREESRREFQVVIDNLKAKGAHGVILGCTEIGLLIHQTDSSLPVFDTTVIHAKQAVELALEV